MRSSMLGRDRTARCTARRDSSLSPLPVHGAPSCIDSGRARRRLHRDTRSRVWGSVSPMCLRRAAPRLVVCCRGRRLAMAVRMAGPDRLARSSRMTTTALTPPGSQTAPAPARLGPGPAGSAVPNCPGPCPSRSWPSRLCGAGPLARTLDRSVPASAERAVARCQRASAPLEQARRSAGTTLSPRPPSEPQPGARRRPRILLAQRRTKSEGGLVRRELPAERPAACRPSDLESVSGVESGRSRAISPQSPRRNPDCDSIHLNSR